MGAARAQHLSDVEVEVDAEWLNTYNYFNVILYVIANDSKKYEQVINSFIEHKDRYRFISNNIVGELYSAEKNLKQLRIDIGL